jgi:hypothetical protein
MQRREVPTTDSCTAEKSGKLHGSIPVAPKLQHRLFGMSILAQITSDNVLGSAHQWLCR